MKYLVGAGLAVFFAYLFLPRGVKTQVIEKPWWLPGERYVEPEPDEPEDESDG